MNANKAIRDVLKREGKPSTEASILMGRKRAYLSAILSQDRDPRASTLAAFAEAMNYELVLRSRDDGFEFIIAE